MCEKNRNASCLAEVLEKILQLQQRKDEHEECLVGCNKPFLGEKDLSCLNTRPITLYCCCTDKKWMFPATVNGRTVQCDVFKIESLSDRCATFRCLVHRNMNVEELNNCEDEFMATDDFFIIDLNCIAAMKCLKDTHVACL